MEDWSRAILRIIDEIDGCIRSGDGEAVTLARLARRLGYSEFYVSRKFKEISGMQLRDYLRDRKLAHALREIRDTDGGLLGIALKYGYSSHEAFTRAFREAYGRHAQRIPSQAGRRWCFARCFGRSTAIFWTWRRGPGRLRPILSRSRRMLFCTSETTKA